MEIKTWRLNRWRQNLWVFDFTTPTEFELVILRRWASPFYKKWRWIIHHNQTSRLFKMWNTLLILGRFLFYRRQWFLLWLVSRWSLKKVNYSCVIILWRDFINVNFLIRRLNFDLTIFNFFRKCSPYYIIIRLLTRSITKLL